MSENRRMRDIRVRTDTTRVYLRRQDSFEAMGHVRDLSWGRRDEDLEKEKDPRSSDRADMAMGPPRTTEAERSRALGAPRAADGVVNNPRREASRFPSSPAVPPTGFEPVFQDSPLPALLGRKLAELQGESITKNRGRAS